MGQTIADATPQSRGARLARLLKEQGWSYRTLSQHVGKSHATIGNWCNGGAISDEDLEILARVLGVTPAWLRYGDAVGTRPDGHFLDVDLLARTIAAVEQVLHERMHDVNASERGYLTAKVYQAAVVSNEAPLGDEALKALAIRSL